MIRNKKEPEALGVKLKANTARVLERIAEAALRGGRNPEDVTLVSVTKTHPHEVLQGAYLAGLRRFGENRVEEAKDKIPAFERWLREDFAGQEGVEWHMVGHLQRRKAKDALELFDVLESVDTLRLAERIDRMAGADGEKPSEKIPVLLECNVSGERAKYGFEISGWERDEDALARFLDEVREIARLPALKVVGLMTMAPMTPDPQEARPVFRSLRGLRDCVTERLRLDSMEHLSMGMTDDFEVAVEEGATIVRIGRAIFGARG